MRTRVVLTLLLGWVACTGAMAQSTITTEDLQHHRWVLESINGEPLPTIDGQGKVPELDFGEQMTVSGNTGCNQISGKAVLRDGFFLVEAMVSTRMMCAPPWGDIERTLQTLLGSESTISIASDKAMTLVSAGTTLVFQLRDWVAAAGTDNMDAEEGPQGFSTHVSKAGYEKTPPPFGGRNSPAGEVYESDEDRDPAFRFPAIDSAFESWDDWKRKQDDDHGLRFSAHYSTLVQKLSDSLGTEDKASAGVLRGTVRWTLKGKDTPNHGSLNIMVDHRHGFRDVTPANLAGQFGYIGQTGVFYNDMGFAIINLNWQQAFNGGATGLIAGRFDPNDYMNVLGYVNPWSIFSNLAVNLDTSVALPDSSWGIGAGTWLNDQWYVIGGLNDANGFGGDNLEFFEGGAEFFTFAHIGWSPSKNERYFKNVHIMAWHVDEREEAGISSANGVALAANWTFEDKWMPFARLGFSRGSAPIYNESVTLGIIRKFMYRSDFVGLSINHGSPPDTTLRDQTSIEAFWRFQFSEGFAITPSLQVIKDPALNPEEDTVLVWGLRFRLNR